MKAWRIQVIDLETDEVPEGGLCVAFPPDGPLPVSDCTVEHFGQALGELVAQAKGWGMLGEWPWPERDWKEDSDGYSVKIAGRTMARVWSDDYGKSWKWSALGEMGGRCKSHFEGIGECTLRLTAPRMADFLKGAGHA